MLAETASVFGETVSFERLLDRTDHANERFALLAQQVEGNIATVFRQVAMNRFEDAVHTHRRDVGELSTDDFADHWARTQGDLFGDTVEMTDGYRGWWSYIPHFIATPGYVYAYAYGQLLALSVYAQYGAQGAAFVPSYLELLTAGGSKWPEELAASLAATSPTSGSGPQASTSATPWSPGPKLPQPSPAESDHGGTPAYCPRMDIGIFTQTDDIDDLVRQARQIHEEGFETMSIPQIFGVDAITMLGVVARAVPELKFATAVIPTYPRHPAMLAAQAKTLSRISGGRFTLGIGLSHQIVIEGMFGMSFEKPVRHMREYLDVLMPLLANEPVRSEGDTLSFRGGLAFNSPPTPVLIAALGPSMLKLCGARAAGTSTWMTGPDTIRGHVAPTIRAAAEEAGRPEPRIVTSIPVCVTDDPGSALERAAKQFEMYGGLPSYRAMMDREGVDGPAGIAIVGGQDQVVDRIHGFFEAGSTQFNAVTFGTSDEQAATRQVLALANRG